MDQTKVNIYFLKNIYALYTITLLLSTAMIFIGFGLFGIYPVSLFNLISLPHENWIKLEDSMHPVFLLIILLALSYLAFKKFISLNRIIKYGNKSDNLASHHKVIAFSYFINIIVVALIIASSIQFHGWIKPEYKQLQKNFSNKNYDAFFREVDFRFKYQMDRNYIISQIRYSNGLTPEQLSRVVKSKEAIRAQYSSYSNKNRYSLTVISTLSKKGVKGRDFHFYSLLINGLFFYLLTACIFIGNQYFFEFQKAYRNA